MRDYETVFILKPDLTGAAEEKYLAEIQSIIEKAKGKIKKIDKWGKRTLAYQIKKFREGFYVLMEVEFPPEKISSLAGKFQVEENILRHLIIINDREK